MSVNDVYLAWFRVEASIRIHEIGLRVGKARRLRLRRSRLWRWDWRNFDGIVALVTYAVPVAVETEFVQVDEPQRDIVFVCGLPFCWRFRDGP